MSGNLLLRLCILTLLGACAPSTEEHASVFVGEIVPQVVEPTTRKGVDVHRVMVLWDSVCDVRGVPWNTDSTALRSMKTFRDPLLYFDRQGAEAYYECSNASVLVFSDSSQARSAFRKVMDGLGPNASGKHIGHFDKPTKELVSTTFSKSGSTHLLVHDMVIHLRASCGESMNESEGRESFVRVLDDQDAIRSSMRMRCGWSALELVR